MCKLLYVFSLLLFLKPSFGNEKITVKNRILVISSYSPIKEQGNHLIASFLENIKDKTPASVSVEYMDSESSQEFQDWEVWLSSLFNAYEIPPCLVVLIGEEVWSVYRECCPEDWKGIPLVLGGMKLGFIDYKNWRNSQITAVDLLPPLASTFGEFKIAGYYLKDYIEENLRLIQKLQPGVTDIAFCYDNRYHHRFLHDYIDSLVHKFDGMKLHYWVGNQLSTASLLDSIASLGKQGAVISAGWYSDINHYSHAHSKLQNELSRYPGKLIYEIMDQDFGTTNNIGGYFVSGAEIGRDLAHLTGRVLNGEIDRNPFWEISPSPPKYHLNYAVFHRMNFDEKLLDGEIVWHNVSLTVWEKYGEEIMVALLVTLAVLFIIILILVYRWRRERVYISSNRRLQHLLEVMPNMAVVYDIEGRIHDIINPNEIILLGMSPKNLLGMTMAEIALQVPEFIEEAKLIHSYVERTIQTGTIHAFNYQVHCNGTEFCADAQMVPFDKEKVICFINDTTSRVFAEKEVIKYKNFLQSVIDHLPLGIFVKNVSDSNRYIYCNQGLKNFYQRDHIDFLGKNDFELGDPLAEAYHEEDKEVLESNKPISFKREFTDCRGEKHWAVMTKTSLLNNDGSCYIIAILVDMTNDRKNEMELENIRNELAIALDAGSLAAWNYDIEKRLYTSLYRDTFARQGLTDDEVLHIIHPDDQKKYKEFIADLASGKVEKKKEILRFFREGQFGWYETHATGIRSLTTGKVEQIIGTEKNITEELQRQEELEASKFKTDFVIKSKGIVQWDYDVRTRVFSSPNKDSFMYKGISYEEYMALVHPDDWFIIEEALERIFTEGANSINIQVRVKLTGNEYRWVDIHAVEFERDLEGNVVQLTGLRSDITDWKNVTEELIMLRDKAEESNRLKTAFLANMSHEIRTPLNAIVGFSNLIAETDDPAEIEEYCKVIATNNDLLLQLINDILDLSKIEAGQLEFSFSEVRVSEVVEGLRQIYQLRKKEGVEVCCELPAVDCIILTEKNRITQVISNFLTNACKFTSKGFIRIGYEYLEDGLRFYVSDTGKGIAPENIPYVFDRFMKFDAFIQGTGLGLSICKTIINRLGGQIGVDSEFGKGSTFWFTIPCKVSIIHEDGPANGFLPGKEYKVSQDSGNRPFILVAEDNDSNYLLLSSILKKEYRIERAVNGREAVHLYHLLHPALILMDIRMPEMDGLEATSQIRKTDGHIPIIALTANAFDEDREKALSMGCTDYITKPIDASKLINLLKEFLN